jgi:hypothetical protein
MLWVAVRYHEVPLIEIMHSMRGWLDKRQCQPATFEYVISESGVLVRVEFREHAQAVEFAQAFDGTISTNRPLVKDSEVVEARQAKQVKREENVPGRSSSSYRRLSSPDSG